jgi:hypothetical protein
VSVFPLLVIVHALAATVWTGGHLVLDLGVLPRALRERSAAKIRAFEEVFERLGLTALASRGFRNVQLWSDGCQKANLLLANPAGLPVDEPWYLVSNADPRLDLVWSYGQCFCCEQLFRDQKSGIFQLARSGLREPERIDRLLLIVAIAVLVRSLQGYAISLAGLRRQVDSHWWRGMSFVRIGLATLQAFVADTKARLMTWMPIPQRDLGPCIPSRGVKRRRKQPWFTRIELPPRSQPQRLDPLPLAVACASWLRCVGQSSSAVRGTEP